jgi:hypothetical protein
MTKKVIIRSRGEFSSTEVPITPGKVIRSGGNSTASMKNQHHRPPPREYDVFCGKGRERSETLGNKRFKAVVDSYMERYRQAGNSRSLKTQVVETVLSDIRSTGARFFKKGPDGWAEISKERIIRDKIGHALRDSAWDACLLGLTVTQQLQTGMRNEDARRSADISEEEESRSHSRGESFSSSTTGMVVADDELLHQGESSRALALSYPLHCFPPASVTPSSCLWTFPATKVQSSAHSSIQVEDEVCLPFLKIGSTMTEEHNIAVGANDWISMDEDPNVNVVVSSKSSKSRGCHQNACNSHHHHPSSASGWSVETDEAMDDFMTTLSELLLPAVNEDGVAALADVLFEAE